MVKHTGSVRISQSTASLSDCMTDTEQLSRVDSREAMKWLQSVTVNCNGMTNDECFCLRQISCSRHQFCLIFSDFSSSLISQSPDTVVVAPLPMQQLFDSY